MTATIKILHLEDVRSDADLVEHELKKANFGFEKLWVTNKKDFQKALHDFAPDVILSDHSLPSFNSVEAFRLVKEAGIVTPFILVTATISEDFAVSRIKDGVTDYLLKDRLERLPSAITNAIEKRQSEDERQRFLNRIIENENILRETERLAHIGSWKHDLVTGKIYWSDEVFRLCGYEPGEVQPSLKLVLQLIHTDERNTFRKAIRNAVKKTGFLKESFRIIDKKGLVKWVYFEIIIEQNENRQAVALRGFIQDITGQKKAEETIRKSEASLTAIIENTDANIYSISPDLKYLTFNSVLKNSLLKDYGIEIKPGDEVLRFYNEGDPGIQEWKTIYEEAFSGKPLHFTKEFALNGSSGYINFSITPVWEKDKVVALSCYARDITQQKLAEQEIIALNESLEKKVKERTAELSDANKELEAFSYTVAHDLRAPLRVTSGFVGLLLKEHGDNLNEEGKYLLNVITQNATQMSQLVSDLLELSRIGRVTVSPASCDMHQIVQQAIDFVKSGDADCRACIKLLQLPEAKCDAGLIKQVWLNLISNAVKYSGKAAQPAIEIGSQAAENAVVYYIKDNGAGFDMKLSEKLFRPFQRLHKKSEYEGTGVGLALSQLVVSKHGGKMWADAKPGEGATFFFSLPN